MSKGKWQNEVIDEIVVGDSKWVLQKSTSPEGKESLGLRRFFVGKNGDRPTSSGLSLSDLADLKAIKTLLDKAEKHPSFETAPAAGWRIQIGGEWYRRVLDGEVVMTANPSKAKVFTDKASAKQRVTKYGDATWKIEKV